MRSLVLAFVFTVGSFPALGQQSIESFNLNFTTVESPVTIFKRGQSAFQNGQYLIALPILQESVDKGFFAGNIYLANMYEKGLGVSQNLALTRSYRRSAVEQGEAAGHGQAISPQAYKYGVMLQQGQGGPVNNDAAFYYYNKASEYGFAPGYFSAAQLHHNRKISNASDVEACRLYKKVIDMNYSQLMDITRQAMGSISGKCQ